MARRMAMPALVLLLVLGSAAAATRDLKASCTASLATCAKQRTTCNNAKATCGKSLAAANTAKTKCTKDLAQAKGAQATCTTQLAAANKAKTSLTSQLAAANNAKTTCQAALTPLQTEVTQTKALQASTMTEWGLSTDGKDLNDVSSVLEYILANVDQSPKFKEQATALNALVDGLDACKLSNGGLLGSLTGLTDCLNTLLGSVGL